MLSQYQLFMFHFHFRNKKVLMQATYPRFLKCRKIKFDASQFLHILGSIKQNRTDLNEKCGMEVGTTGFRSNDEVVDDA